MRVYYNLFYVIFSFIQSIERGYSYQNDSNRAFNTIIVITLLEIANLVSINPTFFKGSFLYVLVAILLLTNYLFFIHKKKYLTIVSQQQNSNSIKLTYVSYIYSIGSIGAYVFTNVI